MFLVLFSRETTEGVSGVRLLLFVAHQEGFQFSFSPRPQPPPPACRGGRRVVGPLRGRPSFKRATKIAASAAAVVATTATTALIAMVLIVAMLTAGHVFVHSRYHAACSPVDGSHHRTFK